MIKADVYKLTSEIPKGKVTTYGEIARKLGNKHLARVVGNILHNNPSPIIIPCHRVVSSKGKLAENFGSEGKIEDQLKLLSSEGIVIINHKVELKKYFYKFKD